MQRRSFLLTAAAAVFPVPKSFGQTSLGTLIWVQADGLWIRELPDGSSRKIASEEGLRSPRFSPSGEWISYQNRSGELFVLRADGDQRRASARRNVCLASAEKSGWRPCAAGM